MIGYGVHVIVHLLRPLLIACVFRSSVTRCAAWC